jgi:hypothetical protein
MVHSSWLLEDLADYILFMDHGSWFIAEDCRKVATVSNSTEAMNYDP